MNRVFIFIAALALTGWCADIYAQEVAPLQYDLTFTGRGDAQTVQTVKVENLSSGETLTLGGNKVLRLTNTPSNGIYEEEFEPFLPKVTSVIYPNPSLGEANLVFANRAAGQVTIGIYDIQGKQITGGVFRLETGKHTAKLPAMPSGTYIVSLRGKGIDESIRWTSLGGGTGGVLATGIASVETWHAASLQEPEPQFNLKNRNADDIVEMLYEDGELLRLTGVHGNYATIIMKRATVSHAVEFMFIECKDGAGNYYPIVKIGNHYWMAESLKGAPAYVSKRTSTTHWNEGAYNTSMYAFYDYSDANQHMGAYFNRQGAIDALPDGWRLPTSGEVDAMLKALGGYNPAGELLKGKGNDYFWRNTSNTLDETSFGAKATGKINQIGQFIEFRDVAGFWTREKKGENGYFWEIRNNNPTVDLAPGKLISQKTGLQVRAVVDAPSPYEKIINQTFGQKFDEFKATRQNLRRDDDAPLGERFVVTDGTKVPFVAAAGNNVNNQMIAKLNPEDWSKNYLVTADGENTTWNLRLKKSTAQTNASGRQNLVVATWKPNQTTPQFPNGQGKVTLQIFGDEKTDYAHTTIEVNHNFTMPQLPETSITQAMMNEIGYFHTTSNWQIALSYGYSWMLNITAGDINGDGVDDIFISVGSQLIVLDGKTYLKIMERNFSNEFGTNHPNRMFYLRTEIGDVNRDGVNDVVVAISHPAAGEFPRLHIFLGGNIESQSFSQIINDHANARVANIAIGEMIPGDRTNCLALYTSKMGDITSNDVNIKRVAVMKFVNNKFEPIGASFFVGATNYHTNALMESIKLARLRGAGMPNDIIAGNNIFRLNGTSVNSVFAGNPFVIATHGSVWGDQIVVGNFDKNEDGKEQILFIMREDEQPPGWTGYIRQIKTNVSSRFVFLNNDGTLNVSQPPILLSANNVFSLDYHTYPMLGAASSNAKLRDLEFKRRNFTLSEPKIHALLAAPPHYGDYDYQYVMGTSWGKSHLTGTATENASTISSSLTFGFELEFNIPVIGTKLGGLEFTAKLKESTTWTISEETTITKSLEFTAGGDAVVLNAIPYETYTYTIMASDEEEEIGTDLILASQGEAITTMLTLNDFEVMTANDPTVPNVRSIFRHTVGNPFSYPFAEVQIQSNVMPASKRFVYFGNSTLLGSGGSVNNSISIDKTQAESESSTWEDEFELVVTIGGLKAGPGWGFAGSNTITTVTGEGHTIAGIVAGLNSITDRPLFHWNVAWFNYTIGGQTFPVVYYVVRP